MIHLHSSGRSISPQPPAPPSSSTSLSTLSASIANGIAGTNGGGGTSSSGATNSTSVTQPITVERETINYDAQRMIGHGSFGAVFLAKIVETGEVVAIKKVLQDRRFKNRELQIMRTLAKHSHPYVLSLRNYFTSKGQNSDDIYLNLVFEFIPETMYSVAKQYTRAKMLTPLFLVKVYMYQLARALAHIHGMGICHRDIKPQNLLVDPARHVLKLCDFGSAKVLIQGELNVAYICSRFYRAPELVFGSSDYSTAIDVWSFGCVLAELLLGSPLFPGSTGVDQLVEIIKVLGTPTKEELKCMNPNYQEFKFPQIRAHPWDSMFPGTVAEAIDLVGQLLTYIPHKRLKAIEACGHEFFDQLRDPTCSFTANIPTTVPENAANAATTPTPTPELLPAEMFEFTEEELSLNPSMKARLAQRPNAAAIK